MLFTVAAQAQLTVRGVVRDSLQHTAVDKAVVQLLRPDSSYLGGTLASDSGRFRLSVAKGGRYILKLSRIGYKPLLQTVNVKDKETTLPAIFMSTDALVLDEAVVTAKLPPMVIKDDTLVYNADSYKVPEGSAIDELVKRLPGAKIADDGTITINGKTVTRIMLDGRDFMRGNQQTAMKNIPSYIIDKVKAYERKSEMARITGIDDGNEDMVLDFGVKKKFRKGFFLNANGGLGTHDRYTGRLFGSRLYGDLRYSLMGRANNTGNGGKTRSKNTGLNLSYEKKRKLRINGNVNWNHNDSENQTRRSSENFVSRNGAFSNSRSQSLSRNDSWNTRFDLNWDIDTLTRLNVNANAGHSFNDGRNGSRSASYKTDPYLMVDDPLDDDGLEVLARENSVVNLRANKANNHGESTNFGANAFINRRFGNRGRNASLRLGFSRDMNSSQRLSATNVHLFQKKDHLGNDSTYQTNRYTSSSSGSRSFDVQANYTEPLFLRGLFLQMDYSYSHSFSRNNPSTYDFDDMTEETFNQILNGYRGWDEYFNLISFPLDHYYSSDLSRYSERSNDNHNFRLQLRYNSPKLNMNVGLRYQPQRSHFIQDYLGTYIDTTRHVSNLSPTLNLRYRNRFAEHRGELTIRANYRGSTRQPGITDMVNIVDDSDPLNIRMGNPGLSPSFTHNASLSFRHFLTRRHRSIDARLNFSTTQNSISNMVTYDEETGGRITKPENINGNWQLGGGMNLNTAIDTLDHFNLSVGLNGSYQQRVGYITLNRKSSSQKNYTRTINGGMDLDAVYSNDWLRVSLGGNVDYQHGRNELQPKSNLDTWRFRYGGEVTITAPWGMTLNTEMRMNSRRGYNDPSMNTNELIWNASLSQSFLRKRQLLVRLNWRDILQERSSFSRSITSNSRSDTWNSAIHSYAMLTVQYRLNLFGKGRGRRSAERPDRGPRRPEPGGRGNPGGPGGPPPQ